MQIVHNKKPEMAIHQQVKKQQEYKYKGRIVLKKGLKLYEYNLETLELGLVNIDRQLKLDKHGKPVKTNKAFFNPKCLYTQALNEKNAVRKFYKMINEAIS